MADYLTTDAELASIANAIRTKGGTSASLVYPTGFITAINAISAGGGITQDENGYLVLSSDGGGGDSYTIPKGGIRPDAEKVKTWTYDKLAVTDEKATIPTYSTSAVALVSTVDIDTYTVDHTNYAYMVVERILTIPIYKSAYAGGTGKEEYVMSAINYELIYEPGSTYGTIDGSKYYATANPAFVAHGQYSRFIYWNNTTTLGLYTSAAYGAGHTFNTPGINANGTLTVKSPTFQIRGHATYLKQAVYEQVDDIRNQYVIELWRVPKNQNKVNGWDIYSCVDSIINDVRNNNCKLR